VWLGVKLVADRRARVQHTAAAGDSVVSSEPTVAITPAIRTNDVPAALTAGPAALSVASDAAPNELGAAQSVGGPSSTSNGDGLLDRASTNGAAATASSKVKGPSPQPSAPLEELGWVSIPLPFQVQVFEGKRFVGSSVTEKIPLTAGSHELELMNESLQYRATERVQVAPGKTATLTVSLPSGTLQLNATPWADVFVDGRSVGQTPLANVPVPIGAHEIAFRHPSFAEQTRSVVVGMNTAVRVGVDLQK
jgi:hypothetical protein